MLKSLAYWKERLVRPLPGLAKWSDWEAVARRLIPYWPAVLAAVLLVAVDFRLVTNDAVLRGPQVEVKPAAPLVEVRRPAAPDLQGSTTAPGATGEVEAPAGVQPSAGSLADLLPPLKGERLAAFGFQYSETYGDFRLHPGVDLAAGNGTPVLAVLSGRVLEVRRDGPLGGQLIIGHEGSWTSTYANLGEILVREGAQVQRGQVLGRVGEPGPGETGPAHLHLELRRSGEAVDPLPYL